MPVKIPSMRGFLPILACLVIGGSGVRAAANEKWCKFDEVVEKNIRDELLDQWGMEYNNNLLKKCTDEESVDRKGGSCNLNDGKWLRWKGPVSKKVKDDPDGKKRKTDRQKKKRRGAESELKEKFHAWNPSHLTEATVEIQCSEDAEKDDPAKLVFEFKNQKNKPRKLTEEELSKLKGGNGKVKMCKRVDIDTALNKFGLTWYPNAPFEMPVEFDKNIGGGVFARAARIPGLGVQLKPLKGQTVSVTLKQVWVTCDEGAVKFKDGDGKDIDFTHYRKPCEPEAVNAALQPYGLKLKRAHTDSFSSQQELHPIGAKVELLDETQWGPSSLPSGEVPSIAHHVTIGCGREEVGKVDAVQFDETRFSPEKKCEENEIKAGLKTVGLEYTKGIEAVENLQSKTEAQDFPAVNINTGLFQLVNTDSWMDGTTEVSKLKMVKVRCYDGGVTVLEEADQFTPSEAKPVRKSCGATAVNEKLKPYGLKLTEAELPSSDSSMSEAQNIGNLVELLPMWSYAKGGPPGGIDVKITCYMGSLGNVNIESRKKPIKPMDVGSIGVGTNGLYGPGVFPENGTEGLGVTGGLDVRDCLKVAINKQINVVDGKFKRSDLFDLFEANGSTRVNECDQFFKALPYNDAILSENDVSATYVANVITLKVSSGQNEVSVTFGKFCYAEEINNALKSHAFKLKGYYRTPGPLKAKSAPLASREPLQAIGQWVARLEPSLWSPGEKGLPKDPTDVEVKCVNGSVTSVKIADGYKLKQNIDNDDGRNGTPSVDKEKTKTEEKETEEEKTEEKKANDRPRTGGVGGPRNRKEKQEDDKTPGTNEEGKAQGNDDPNLNQDGNQEGQGEDEDGDANGEDEEEDEVGVPQDVLDEEKKALQDRKVAVDARQLAATRQEEGRKLMPMEAGGSTSSNETHHDGDKPGGVENSDADEDDVRNADRFTGGVGANVHDPQSQGGQLKGKGRLQSKDAGGSDSTSTFLGMSVGGT